MASAETWLTSELEKGVLLSETVENGIVTRTYIAPLLEPQMEEDPDPLALPKEYPMPYFCPHCGNGIGSSGAFTMHLRACQRRVAAVKQKEELPEKPQLSCRSCNVQFKSQQAYEVHLKLEKSDPDFKPWSKSTYGPFRCIFCRQEFVVPFALGQMRRRYACDDCGRKARAEEADRQQNPKVKRKVLACNRCGKQYKLEGFLVRHQMLCQGFAVKRKREYELHEITKKMKNEDDNHEVTEVKLEGEVHEVTEKKEEKHESCHEIS